MFSDNQLTFALVFFVVFITILVLLYRKDVQKTPHLSKGVWKVLVAVVVVFLLFYATVRILGH